MKKTGILVPVEGPITTIEVDGTLKGYYKALDCNLIEQVYIELPHNLIVIGDEEAKNTNRPINARLSLVMPGLRHGDVFAGPGLIMQDAGPDWDGVDDAEVTARTLSRRFEQELAVVPKFVADVKAFNEELEAGTRTYF